MNQPSVILFAKDVAQQLLHNAQELSKEPGIKAFCSALAAELANIQQCLEKLGDAQNDAAGEHRVLTLLDNLGQLCQWPTVRSPAPSGLGNTIDCRRRYPTLIRTSTRTKKVMKDFAADPRAKKGRVGLLKFLKAFGKPKKTVAGPELSELNPADAQQQQDDYQAYIRVLYASLASYYLCRRQDDRREIATNLRLNGCCSPGELADSVNFRLFFLDHPHDNDSNGSSQWQDTQICVLRRRRIKLNTEQADTSGTQSGKVISTDAFCGIITNRNRSQLKLAVSDDGLVFHGSAPLSRGFLLSASSVSLAKLLKITKLSWKMKLLLSYFLAKAVWQYYDSDWMQREWTKEMVHFMFEQRSKTPKGIFINEPFLSARFDSRQPAQEKDNEFRSHLLPKILALGIMFLEIELGIDIKDHRMPEDLGPGGEPAVNADHIAAMEVFNETEWDKRETFGVFRHVIGACLIPDDFKPFLDDIQGLRDALKKHILNPLQNFYKDAWENPDTSHVRPIEIDISGPSRPGAIEEGVRSVLPPVPSATPWKMSSLLDGVMPVSTSIPPNKRILSTRSFPSDDWFQELDKLNSVLRVKPKERHGPYQPVKIAILDTGVSEDFADFVKGYKDFVSNDDYNWQDNTGHGTNAVRLIQKVYNMAEIYIGRVFEAHRATANTATLMAQAIRHAKGRWKVDIIVMPSGFRSENRDMEIAIDEARNDHILIFAPASNYGNVVEIAFPGRLYRDFKLLCMFCTDHNVRAPLNFNPSVMRDARYSFAILGCDIVLPHVTEPLSGTSYATMIGAAVAGRILDFTRHRDTCERIRRLEKLKTVEGMSAVFLKMAKNAVDNGYHCIAPWKILPPEIPGESNQETKDEKRSRERADVCETISRALEDGR
ncbi:hypothetical protein Egran_03256 [Elaphomyces granulatus]|uniref:Peptidase S8/S53 domain-containing protein n=1 Tax=Elaphomyces granulatus TaxID=519963 RepID=A0A232LXY5_9EURO|nr:hypothetical protein Egran_03256 [Elaphomyces granulatus]